MRLPLLPAVLLLAAASALGAQTPDPARLSVERIFKRNEFRSATMPDVRWMKDGRSYVDLRANAGGGSDVVRVDVVTGAATVLADAAALVDRAGKRLDVEEITLSADESRALLFSNSVRVWRTNTRGAYHVVDFATKKVTPIATITTPGATASTDTDTSGQTFLGRQPGFLARGLASGAADPVLQQFAKFSPDGRRVAFVRANDLWVTELATGRTQRLTRDGSDDVINGTTDWVHEEELGLKDAFRWSPDSRRIAFWRFDQTAVPAFPMVDEVSSLYPRVSVLRYPKAGMPNARVTLHVVDLAGGARRRLAVGPDTGQYLAQMEWVGPDSLAVQRLPRKQDRLDLLLVSATTGTGRTVLVERDSAYVDVEDGPVRWIDGGRRLLLRSDRTGWQQVFLYDRSGSLVRQVTRDGVDVLTIDAVDEAKGELYVTVAAPHPSARVTSEREMHRFALDGTRAERLTREPGTHAVSLSPDFRYAVDTWSAIGRPPTMTLYELPAMKQVRVLEDNAQLAGRVGGLAVRAPELFRLPAPDGTLLDAYRIVPADFDSTRKHPVLIFTYGGPARPQVNDAWGGNRYLWHQMLAQRGYVVVAVDPRGASLRGRAFRKGTQHRLGVLESQDVIDAASWLAGRPWVDAGRIGLWGWSYGGYLTALSMARGGSLFKAGIAVAPVVDWRYYDTIYTERFMWLPSENARGYEQSSVLTHLGGLTARLLLVHGTGDDNVHPQNAMVLANALQAQEKPFTMLLYPNRTHAISGGATQAHLYESFTRFLLEQL